MAEAGATALTPISSTSGRRSRRKLSKPRKVVNDTFVEVSSDLETIADVQTDEVPPQLMLHQSLPDISVDVSVLHETPEKTEPTHGPQHVKNGYHTRPVPCQVCGKQFPGSGAAALLQHVLSAHSFQPWRPYDAAPLLPLHALAHHMGRQGLSPSEPLDLTTCPSPPQPARHLVSLLPPRDPGARDSGLGSVTPSPDALMAGSTMFPCPKCPQSFASLNGRQLHLRLAHPRPLSCKKCGVYCATREQARAHHLTHLEEKRYTCEVCQQTFKRRDHLKIHMQRHTGVIPHRCDICHRGFGTVYKLNRHMRSHTKEKPYQCEICNKRFPYDNTYKRHLRLHTGEKGYRCTFCATAFYRPDALKVHLEKKHQIKTKASPPSSTPLPSQPAAGTGGMTSHPVAPADTMTSQGGSPDVTPPWPRHVQLDPVDQPLVTSGTPLLNQPAY